MAGTDSPLVEAWRINNRVTLGLLARLEPGDLDLAPFPRGRTIGSQLAHLVNNRHMWLSSCGPAEAGSFEKIEADARPTLDTLRLGFELSGDAFARFIAHCEAAGGKVRGYKRPIATLSTYMIAHDAHHRGNILLTLRIAGKPLDKESVYAMWKWDTI